jgi:hypothetical protein
VVATSIGRALYAVDIVHHRNGDKADNRLENLELTTRGAHNAHHNAERGRNNKGRFQPTDFDGRTWDEFPE